jgi:hypothetical protein
MDSGRNPRSPRGRGPSRGASAEGPGDRSLLHLPERSFRGARREDPGESRVQTGAPPVRRARCLDTGGLCCGDRGRARCGRRTRRRRCCE